MEGVETQTRLLQLLLFRSDWISKLFALNTFQLQYNIIAKKGLLSVTTILLFFSKIRHFINT